MEGERGLVMYRDDQTDIFDSNVVLDVSATSLTISLSTVILILVNSARRFK